MKLLIVVVSELMSIAGSMYSVLSIVGSIYSVSNSEALLNWYSPPMLDEKVVGAVDALEDSKGSPCRKSLNGNSELRRSVGTSTL